MGSNLTIILRKLAQSQRRVIPYFRLSAKNLSSYMSSLPVNVYLKDVSYEWNEVCVCIERLGMW